MKVEAYRKPRAVRRPPTELERKLAEYYAIWHPFDTVDEIEADFNLTWAREGARIVDHYDNILLAWFPSMGIAVQLYYTRKNRSYSPYTVSYVVQCPDEYEEEY